VISQIKRFIPNYACRYAISLDLFEKTTGRHMAFCGITIRASMRLSDKLIIKINEEFLIKKLKFYYIVYNTQNTILSN
jgi:hypothetical protein